MTALNRTLSRHSPNDESNRQALFGSVHATPGSLAWPCFGMRPIRTRRFPSRRRRLRAGRWA
jgi:hypothetical protein